MDDLTKELNKLNGKEYEGLQRAISVLKEAGFSVGLSCMYQSEAKLAIMISKNNSTTEAKGDCNDRGCCGL